MGWLLYLTGLVLCLGVTWRWFPRSRLWMLLLATVGIALAAPWSALPAEKESDLAPAAIIALFSLAFEPDIVQEALRVSGAWAATFLVLCAVGIFGGALIRYRRRRKKQRTLATEEA